MHTPALLAFLPVVASTLLPISPQYIFDNPSSEHPSKIPTSYESAVLARRILNLTPLGTLSTVFPTPHASNTLEQRPSGLGGVPIGLMDYIADCEPGGNPTILAINIATSFKNAAAGSNLSLSLQWTPPYPPKSRIESLGSQGAARYSAANLPRFSLIGYLEKIQRHEVETLELAKCFTKAHPDAKYWLPGNSIHESEWVRLVVQDVYWIGGFGDRAYIGWIPVGEWTNVTTQEWQKIRLPGEKKGWHEWAVESFGQWEL
ncbi:hypothetical protein D0Z07_1565 [Hyphodiscus hymeniophilus]|uniref:CREG-like beta-barrel domain-containing protein n=1 Tax=Hyphodiscus hymeniophilus TaxID=353542 RepID=A0A9P6VPS6_9HELO|nr:hypothetical protein D0Z07_1565 [Hyphodiscus hymeniophilus]